MSQRNKEVVQSWWDAYNRHDIDAAAAVVTEDMLNHHSTNQGRDGLRAELDYWFAAFPDVSARVDDLIAEGDRVVARVTATGTHGGEFMGKPASGTRITAQEIDVFRIEDGKIAEVWPAPDIYAVLAQLDMLPSDEPVA